MYFCTASDHKYFAPLINLIGSIHATNYEQTKEIAIFDLGMTQEQKNFLNTIDLVTVHAIEKVNEDVLTQFRISNNFNRTVPGWFSWKPVVIKQCLDMFPHVLWVDAGTTILKPLDSLFEHIVEVGYFFSTIGQGEREKGSIPYPIGWGASTYVKNFFNLQAPDRNWILDEETVMGGIIGCCKSKKVYEDIFLPMYHFAQNIKLFQDDGTTPDGFGTGRCDQTLWSILVRLKGYPILFQDYMQKKPILLCNKEQNKPFFVTWLNTYVDEKTSIYSSRTDIKNINFYKQQIRFK